MKLFITDARYGEIGGKFTLEDSERSGLKIKIVDRTTRGAVTRALLDALGFDGVPAHEVAFLGKSLDFDLAPPDPTAQ